MKTTIQRWGNSLAVRIPKTLAQETAFDEGDEVDLRADDNRIVMERLEPKHYRLSDLLAGVTKANRHDAVANRHDAVDSGPPVNREAW
jgi:antitoxin MazE